jgi:hypothetical protein
MRSNPNFSNRWPYLLVTLIWIITRAYPLSQAHPSAYWEVAEAKKLLEYGFCERQGAIINIHFMTGVMPEPWKFNYVNHPYPILWLDTFIYWFGGPWTVLLAASLLGLLTCLAVIPALGWCFSLREAAIGASLYTLAPATILFDADTNIVALGAIVWPMSIYLLGRAAEQKSLVAALLLGVVVFVAGQISWFTYTALPVLLVATAALAYSQSGRFVTRSSFKLFTATILGGLLTLSVFLFQIWFYSYDLAGTLSYIQGQAGGESGATMARMYFAIAMRSILSVGPALALGSLVAAFLITKTRSVNWLQLGSILYPLSFVTAALILPRFFYRERTMYGYLILPCTVLTLTALRYFGNKRITLAAICLAAMSLAYPALQASIPKVSETSKKLGCYIREITRPDEVVMTNLEEQRGPFQPWDVGSITNTCLISDRAIREKISTRQALQAVLKDFRTRELNIVFLRDLNKQIDASLRNFLQQQPRVESVQFEIPQEPLSPATRLRSFYWKIAGKHQSLLEADTPGKKEQFEVFRFKLSGPLSASDGARLE